MHWKEDYLQFIWKYQLFDTKKLKTTRGEGVVVFKTGLQNSGQGPDFKHASVQIGQEIFHGHIEIHMDNKEWYLHRHESDPHYDNVILHVVFNTTAEAYTLASHNQAIPILCLENHIHKHTLEHLDALMSAKKDIPCQGFYRLPPIIKMSHLIRYSHTFCSPLSYFFIMI